MMSGAAIKYLCAALNSRLITWYMGNTALNSGMGVTRWIRHTVEDIPILSLTEAKQRPLVVLVDRILDSKGADAAAYPGALDVKLDGLVYARYGFTLEEIAAIGGA